MRYGLRPTGRRPASTREPAPALRARPRPPAPPADGAAAPRPDLADPDAVLADPAVRQVIDPGQPVCLIMACTLHFLEAAAAQAVTAAYMSRVAPGSQIAVSVVHIASARMRTTPSSAYTAGTFFNHGHRAIAGWLAGWQLLPPGMAEARRWVSRVGGAPSDADSYVLCAAAVKEA
ncbi:MAG: SAM-dependent methyltransferase [Streptosporangiaceae bacterium]